VGRALCVVAQRHEDAYILGDPLASPCLRAVAFRSCVGAQCIKPQLEFALEGQRWTGTGTLQVQHRAASAVFVVVVSVPGVLMRRFSIC
jgi:hypothetical protein